MQPNRLAKPSFDPVAFDGVSVLARDSQAEPRDSVIFPVERLDKNKCAADFRTTAHCEKF
jgi:hypothetical protein